MNITGEITKTDDGAYTGYIASLTLDADINLLPNDRREKENHPNFIVYGKSPRGRDIEIGAAWAKTSKTGNPYLSISVEIGSENLRLNGVNGEGHTENFTLKPYVNDRGE